jgi:hypothetical protein
MSSLWSKVTGLFRPKSEPLSKAARIEQEIRSLRVLALQIMKSSPETYLGSAAICAESFDGDRWGDLPVDYYAIKITEGNGEEALQNINTMYYKLRPDLSEEAVKAYLLRLALGDRRKKAVERMPWEEASQYFLPRVGLNLYERAVHLPWGDLSIGLVLDFPEQVFYVGPHLLDRWGRTAEDVLEVAIANLRRRYGETRASAFAMQDAPELQVWEVLASEPDVNASLVLLPEVTGSIPVPPDSLFVLIPYRTSLMFFVRPESAERRQDLVGYAARQNWASGVPVSPHLLVWSGDVLVKSSAEEILGYAIEFEEPGAGAQLFAIPDPNTGEKRSIVYPLRHGT